MWVPNIEFFLIAFEKKVEMCVFFGGEIPFGKSKISYAEMPCINSLRVVESLISM